MKEKEENDFIPEIIEKGNEDQRLYGICFNNSPNLYNEMIGLSEPQDSLYPPSQSSSFVRQFSLNQNNISSNSINSDIYEKKEEKSLYQKLLISHNSIFKNAFDIIVLILVNISSIRILYDYCFIETNDDYNNLFIDEPLHFVIEAFFAIFIILQFFQTYQENTTLLIIRDFKKIALRYIKGWFFIDFLSIIPFDYFIPDDSDLKYLKMLRFLRFPKFLQTIDVKRFDNLASSFLTKGDSEDASKRLNVIFNIRYFFKIIRLMIMSSLVAYILGCVWYLICLKVFEHRFNVDYPDEETFFTKYKIYKKTPIKRLMLSCYYVLTGLTTVGYGDYNATNDYEKIFGITVMFLGVAIFSYVLSEFSDQINIYNTTFGEKDKGTVLHNHISLLNEFCTNQHFSEELIKKIKNHFKFFWRNNRMFSIDKNDKYLSNLPKDLNISLVEYFWYDIFTKYNNFLLYRKYKNVYYKFYYELSFLLMPRLFSKDEIIYKVDEEVEELYLIMEGVATMEFGKYKNLIHHTMNFFPGNHLGVYFCLYNVNAEFEFVASEECKLYGINKIEFLKLLKDYPEIEDKMREIQYHQYQSIKNQMDNGLKKKINDYNNKVDSEEQLIKYNPKPMVDFDKNKNGMTINTFLDEEIRKKEDEIQKLNETLEQKCKEEKNKLMEIKKIYMNLKKEYREKYNYNFSSMDN